MKLYVKNQISLGGSSKVYNENEELVYVVKGKILSPTHKKFIMDMNNQRLYIVRNKYWSFISKSSFILDANKKRVAQIKKEHSLKTDFKVLGTEDEYLISGNVFSWNYNIEKNGAVIGSIVRKTQWVGEAFELDVENEEDVPFLIAFVIAIDNIIDEKQK